MKRCRILPHTADVRLFVEGDSLQELFTAALEGVTSVLKKGGCKNRESFIIKDKLTLSAPDATTLLVDFLSEVVSRSYANRALYCTVLFYDLTPVSLSAYLAGVPVKKFDEDIKAVTYHEANVIKNSKGLYKTSIVLDI